MAATGLSQSGGQTAAPPEQAAFMEMVRRHLGLVTAAVRARLPADLAEDAAAETFLRAWRGRQRLHAADRPGNWLYGIAVRVCHEMRRQEARTINSDPVSLASVPADPPADDGPAEALAAAVAALDEPLREVIHLKYAADLSYDRMAATLGVSVATIGQRLTRARQELRRRLAEH